MKRISLLAFLILPLLAQTQNTMYFMESLPQISRYNPAFIPKVKFYVGMPGVGGVSANAYNTGFHYNWLDDFISSVGTSGFNAEEAMQSIGEYNKLFADAQTNLFSLGFKLKEKGFISFSATVNNSSGVKVGSDIALLLSDPDDLTDEDFPIVVDDMNIMANNYISMGVTYSRAINEHLTLGITPRLNFNVAGLRTEHINFQLDKVYDTEGGSYDYEPTFSGKAYLALPTEINPDALDGNELNLDESILPDNWLEEAGASGLTKNKSLSLDIGGTYEWDRWMFSGSVLNIGSSRWKENGYLLTGNTDVITSTEEEVSIAIPTQIYLGARRQFSPKWNYGLMFHNSFYKEGSLSSATLSLNGWVGKWLSVSTSYTAGYKYNNLGLGLRMRFLPGTDLYFVTDNVIQAVDFKNAYRMTAALGINISYGINNGSAQLVEEE